MTRDMCHLSLTLFGPFLIHDLSPGFQLKEHDVEQELLIFSWNIAESGAKHKIKSDQIT